MYKFSVKKQNVLTNQATFPSLEEGNVWLEQEKLNNSFGRNNLELIDSELNPVSEEMKELATSTEEVLIGEETLIKYFIPAEYTIEIEDVTAQLQKETRMRETAEAGAKARAACDAALDHVAGYNLMRELTPEQITTMTQTFSTIMTLLAVAKRPGEARKAILLVDPDGAIVTEELKEDLLQILKDY